MQLLVTGADRWAVQGIAQALLRAGASTGLEVASTPVEALAGDADADVLLVVQATPQVAQRVVSAVAPALPVLWLGGSASPAPHDARPTGMLAAQSEDARVLAAVQALAAGLHVADAQAGLQAPRTGGPVDGAGEPLTPRELEVFELLAKGLANRDIALALGISSHTAKFHVAQILEKTGAATRTEAVRQGLRMGWIGL
jgi:DNA-binding NarL/FixJ family response regulator